MTAEEPDARPARAWLGTAVGILLCAVVFVALAAWSWGKWPDIQVDFGRELYVPWRLAEGEVLFRDLAWFNGPLSPYFNAMWFELFGASFGVLVWVNLTILALTGVALYRLMRSCSSQLAAFVATLTLFGVFGFGHVMPIGNYNWISPYSHEMTHGTALGIVAMLCLSRLARSLRWGWGLGTGLCLGLVFLTKAEITAAAVLGVAAGLLFVLRAAEPAAGAWRLRAMVAVLVGALLPPLVALGLLALRLPLGTALLAVCGSWQGVVSSSAVDLEFYRRGMGFDAPGLRLGVIFTYAAWIGLPLLALAGIDLAVGQRRAPSRLAAGLAAVAGAAVVLLPSEIWLEAPAPLPLFLLLAALVLGRRAWRAERGDPQPALRLGLVLFALGMLFKTLLATRVQQYGFALTAPAVAVLAAAVACWIPGSLVRRGGSGLVFGAGALGVLLGAALAYGRLSQANYAEKVQPVGNERDRFYADWRAQFFKAALAYCRQVLPADAEVLVLPEGVMLNYLLKRRTPTSFVNFMPPEMALFGEANMLAELEKHPPAAVILVHKPTAEYGPQFEFFGAGTYGDQIMAWVYQNYRGTQLFGEAPLRRGTRFGVAVLEPR